MPLQPRRHRNMRRPNWLGISRCRLVKVDGLDLHVEDLDAVDGTPVLEVKPWFEEMGPRGKVRQAQWTTDMLGELLRPHQGLTTGFGAAPRARRQ
ncbi:TrmO family methyltransferase domain-containing protein [Streptomyces sp. CA-243310]|uniref:TrmO family methyltransferase domain-containing protein n=1 Tax=Streptomyces sp. CA-243310 TaxID=3240056 RepID=UPI003D909102